MASEEKRKPIEERIASLMGKSAYVDLRDGVGGTNPLRLKDQDIAAGLGVVSRLFGPVAAMVLETYYASTLTHSAAIRRAWDERERRPRQTATEITLTRFGCELAIREMAGHHFGTPELADYAYLIVSRRESLQRRKNDAFAWMDELRSSALIELKRQLRDSDVAA